MLCVSVTDIVQVVWAIGFECKSVLYVLRVSYVLVIKILQVVSIW